MEIALVIGGGVLAALLVLAALAWFFGWGADWARPLRASATDAGERTADGLAEFWDWLRLGR